MYAFTTDAVYKIQQNIRKRIVVYVYSSMISYSVKVRSFLRVSVVSFVVEAAVVVIRGSAAAAPANTTQSLYKTSLL